MENTVVNETMFNRFHFCFSREIRFSSRFILLLPYLKNFTIQMLSVPLITLALAFECKVSVFIFHFTSTRLDLPFI